jgi:hypothetical protein
MDIYRLWNTLWAYNGYPRLCGDQAEACGLFHGTLMVSGLANNQGPHFISS